MSGYSIVLLLSLIIYVILITGILLYARTRLKKLFLVFLMASASWGLTSYLASVSPDKAVLDFGKLVPLFASWAVIAYAHFVAAFTRIRPRIVMKVGYAYLHIVAIFTVLGCFPQLLVPLEGAPLYNDYGYSLYLLTVGGAIFAGTAVFLLIRSYRSAKDPDHRNRIAYLLAGISLLIIFGAIFEFMPNQKYAFDHIGHLGNSLLITYAIFRYKLLDMKLIFRKGLVYAGITAFITASFIVMLYGLDHMLQTTRTSSLNLVIPVGIVILMALLFNPLRVSFEKLADRLFYGNRYDYRKMVLSFASRMSNILEMDELAESMLRPIVNAVSASQASLLLASDGCFSTQFAERLENKDPVVPVRLRKDGAVISWFEKEDRPLLKETINTAPEFRGLRQEEKNALEAAQVEILCPIKSKHELIALLAISKKQPRGHYSRDDVDMLMTLSHEAAVVIDNAQLYARTRQRANTDELTGLFNHRYFHERLDEEIARCSRFGKIFSLVFLDIDMFKNYNDAYGHLAGDKVVEKIGTLISQSVRTIDISSRYGGDEFALLLPETPLENAAGVAERIRKLTENRTDLEGIPLTCSIGIASWPTDGIMREEIIRATDAALYYAKQTGGNRVCWACEVTISDVLRIEETRKSDNKTAILNTIYALAATVDAKDHHTYGHSRKVSKYAVDIAEALGYTQEAIETVRIAALLHDIGKIGIPDQLLSKREPLNSEEWEHIQAHPNLGVSIIKHVDSLHSCLAAIQYHHERYDGSGYPSGLKGNNIPLDARILGVADAYDAMTSQRPYRPVKMTHEQAVEELISNSGTQFDPVIVDVFINIDNPSLAAATIDSSEA